MKKPLSFIHAATFVAGTLLAANALGTMATTLQDTKSTLSPNYAQQLPSTSTVVGPEQRMTLEQGMRVNVLAGPTQMGQTYTQMELGGVSVSFQFDAQRVPEHLRKIEGMVSNKYQDLDVRHATLFSVHEVFSTIDSDVMKSDLSGVATAVQARVQDRLDRSFAGTSPYVITSVTIDDACVVSFGLTSDRCTPAMVSHPMPSAPSYASFKSKQR